MSADTQTADAIVSAFEHQAMMQRLIAQIEHLREENNQLRQICAFNAETIRDMQRASR